MKLQVMIHPAEEGGFWAEIPAFAGCVSEGETLEETLLNIKEAAEGWLEVAALRKPKFKLLLRVMKSISGKAFCKLLHLYGWELQRIRGSHHI
jgi:predicted RNase H-like HicB family nuclease